MLDVWQWRQNKFISGFLDLKFNHFNCFSCISEVFFTCTWNMISNPSSVYSEIQTWNNSDYAWGRNVQRLLNHDKSTIVHQRLIHGPPPVWFLFSGFVSWIRHFTCTCLYMQVQRHILVHVLHWNISQKVKRKYY